ncbi:MAG: transglutaminase-like cysteine peptidase [Pseudomonadota bacterium]
MPFLPTTTRLWGARLLGAATLLVTALTVAQVDFPLMRQVAAERYGQDTATLVDHWRTHIEAMKALPDEEKLRRANLFFNSRIRWVQDPHVWQEPDYWATPLEMMGRGMGDCEDFAIAKYATLVLAGIQVEKLRITYVKARLRDGGSYRNQAHMVLAYYPSSTSEPVILDNIIPDIYPASKRSDLTPVYGFNSQGIWVGGAPKPASTEPEARLSRWRDLLRRAADEGLG